LTKRFGIVGASQLPLQYLLAFKSPFSPIQKLTRCSWETLNAAHQILGRVSTILFYLHAGFYLNFFIQAHVLAKRIKDWDVILGIVGTIAFTAVGTTALSWIRKLSYRVFYTTHVTLASILLPVLYFHVHHIRIYIIETLIVYAVHLALRIFNEYKVEGSLTLVPGTANLLEINIPITKQKSIMQWQPGQHVYVSLAHGPIYTRSLKSRSPFTIASLPSEDGNLKLVARVLDGSTAALAKAATEGATGKATSIPLILEGPYGLSTHPNTLLQYSRVLFIAGGVGATFVVPLYKTLLRDLSPSPGSRRRQNVAFVWIVRDEAETTWAVPEDEQEHKGMQERMTVYATRSGRLDGEKQNTDDTDDGIELERLLSSGGIDDSVQKWQIHPGRPDLGEMVDGVFNHTRNDTKVAVIVCGPRSMADEVRRNSSKWVGKRDIWLHVEAFGL
jgi:ferredoxin-NADP reductase